MAKPSVPALGILLPITLGNTGYFNQGFDILSQVKSNLINLILTKKGERIMQPDFGCDVHRLVFEQLTDDTLGEIKAAIQQSIKLWMPYLTINNVDVNQEDDLNIVTAAVSFTINLGMKITDSVTLRF